MNRICTAYMLGDTAEQQEILLVIMTKDHSPLPIEITTHSKIIRDVKSKIIKFWFGISSRLNILVARFVSMHTLYSEFEQYF